ncbi:MAG: thioredoxin family protein [Candidatus Paceibacterota bacterium]
MEETKKTNGSAKMSQCDLFRATTVIFFIIAVALGVYAYLQQKTPLTPDAAANKAIAYINEYFDTTKSTTLASVDSKKLIFYKFEANFNGQKVPSYISADGTMLFGSNPLDTTKDPNTGGASTAGLPEMQKRESVDREASFKEITGLDVCKEGDKPIIYFFGSETCPHCQWEKPIIESVAASFGDAISFHENIDSANDQELFAQYSDGSVPAIVLGCKFYRLGSGESIGADAEKAALTKLICELTGNQPASVCQ